jgi:chemotaxis protein CheD
MSLQNFMLGAPRMVVGISDLAVTNSPNVFLTTYALGSCVGMLAYSKRIKAAGLLHAMLPTKRAGGQSNNPLMFVDTGMEALLRELGEFGVSAANLNIALIGGASVSGSSNFFRIGEDNVAAAKAFCMKHRLKITYEDSGGKVNRTMHFKLADFSLEIKKPQEVQTITLV